MPALGNREGGKKPQGCATERGGAVTARWSENRVFFCPAFKFSARSSTGGKRRNGRWGPGTNKHARARTHTRTADAVD